MLSATLSRAQASVVAEAWARLAARCFTGAELGRGEGEAALTAGSLVTCDGVGPAAPVLPAGGA